MTDPMKTASERLDELLGPNDNRANKFPDDILHAAQAIADTVRDTDYGPGPRGEMYLTTNDDAAVGIIADAIHSERERCISIIDGLMQQTMKMRDSIEVDRLDRANISGFLEACILIKRGIASGNIHHDS